MSHIPPDPFFKALSIFFFSERLTPEWHGVRSGPLMYMCTRLLQLQCPVCDSLAFVPATRFVSTGYFGCWNYWDWTYWWTAGLSGLCLQKRNWPDRSQQRAQLMIDPGLRSDRMNITIASVLHVYQNKSPWLLYFGLSSRRRLALAVCSCSDPTWEFHSIMGRVGVGSWSSNQGIERWSCGIRQMCWFWLGWSPFWHPTWCSEGSR